MAQHKVATGKWPFEYKGWKVTFNAAEIETPSLQSGRLGQLEKNTLWLEPVYEHLHGDAQQLMRRTKKKVFKFNQKDGRREDGPEQWCCFVCAKYMPKEVQEYFYKCREMIKDVQA